MLTYISLWAYINIHVVHRIASRRRAVETDGTLCNRECWWRSSVGWEWMRRRAGCLACRDCRPACDRPWCSTAGTRTWAGPRSDSPAEHSTHRHTRDTLVTTHSSWHTRHDTLVMTQLLRHTRHDTLVITHSSWHTRHDALVMTHPVMTHPSWHTRHDTLMRYEQVLVQIHQVSALS